MTQFEYLSTFVSILYAIMVGRTITVLAGLARENVSWRHVVWIAILLINILQTWWMRWGGHDEVYHYGWFILSVLHTIPLMFAVATLCPSKTPDSWSTYFEANRVRFFASYGTFWVTIGLSNFMGGSNWTGTLGPLIFTIVGAIFPHRYVQTVIQIVFLMVFATIGVSMAMKGV
jgi:hypothetical protein